MQDQRKKRLISWQYFTKRLTRQRHHLWSSDYEKILLYYTNSLIIQKAISFKKKKNVHLLFGLLPC